MNNIHRFNSAEIRFTNLDGFRALAILLVFTAHPVDRLLWDKFNGPSGVTLFFVLSGFLITTILLREELLGRVNLRKFYIKRFFRIYPMYFLILFVYIILIGFFNMVPERRNIFFNELPFYLSPLPEHAFFEYGSELPVPGNGFWSIGIEEKFYIVWPLIGFGAIVFLKRIRMILLTSLSPFLIIANSVGGNWIYLAPYLPIVFGCIGGLLFANARHSAVLTKIGEYKIRYLLLALTAILQFSSSQVLLGGYLYPVISLLFLLVILAFASSERDCFFSSDIMKFLSEISYSFYLIHNFLLNFSEKIFSYFNFDYVSIVSASIGFLSAIIISKITFEFFESPLRDIGRKISQNF